MDAGSFGVFVDVLAEHYFGDGGDVFGVGMGRVKVIFVAIRDLDK